MAVKDNPLKKAFLINALRRASYRWPSRYKALKRCHIGRNEYYCESCGIVVPKKGIALDHVEPVIDPSKGWEDLDVYADRMLTNDEWGFQCLCHPCHDSKTSVENSIRKETRQKKKNNACLS